MARLGGVGWQKTDADSDNKDRDFFSIEVESEREGDRKEGEKKRCPSLAH